MHSLMISMQNPQKKTTTIIERTHTCMRIFQRMLSSSEYLNVRVIDMKYIKNNNFII